MILNRKFLWVGLVLIVIFVIGIVYFSSEISLSPDGFLLKPKIKSAEISKCYTYLDNTKNLNKITEGEIREINKYCKNLEGEIFIQYAQDNGFVNAENSCTLEADFDGDNDVDFDDLIILLNQWGFCENFCTADINGDGYVNFDDLIYLLSRWGSTNEDCTECNDERDNDDDGLIDAADPGCWDESGEYDSSLDNEAVATSACQDGEDNDNDGLIDYPEDNGCGNPLVYTEVYLESLGPDCSDGFDNDNDGFTDWGATEGKDTFCSSPFDSSEQDVLHEEIGWYDFQDFTLDNIIMVYAGLSLGPTSFYPDREDFGDVPLRRGFSQVEGNALSDEAVKNIPFEHRSDVFFPPQAHFDDPVNDEPWANDRIPWGNNMVLYQIYWDRMLDKLSNRYEEESVRVTFLTADNERSFQGEEEILGLCTNERVPLELRELCQTDPDAFIHQYRIDMAALYDLGVSYFKDRVDVSTQVSAYTDVPLHTRTVSRSGINKYSWDVWITNHSLLNYITCDYENPGETKDEMCENFGPFITETLDFTSPSAYLSRNYPPENYPGFDGEWEKAGGYLADILFRTDANAAWTPEASVITPHLWMRFHISGNCKLCGHRPWMAHAEAIFPHFSKNTGGWIFDWDGYINTNDDRNLSYVTDEMQSQNRIAYDNLIYGLYRLDKYEEFFSPESTVYHPMNARDLFKNKSPVWRGRILNGKMLVAAHNPYAYFTNVTEFVITDPNGREIDRINVNGLNTWLGVCDLQFGRCNGDEGDNFVENRDDDIINY